MSFDSPWNLSNTVLNQWWCVYSPGRGYGCTSIAEGAKEEACRVGFVVSAHRTLAVLTRDTWVDSIPRGPSGHKWRVCAKSFLRPSGSLVLNSGNYPSLSGGKELTPLPPQEEKSSSPPPLPSLGPLWGGNGEGDDAVEKDLPAAEGIAGGQGRPFPGAWGWRGRCSPSLWEGGARSVCGGARVSADFSGIRVVEGGPSRPLLWTPPFHLPFFAPSRRRYESSAAESWGGLTPWPTWRSGR